MITDVKFKSWKSSPAKTVRDYSLMVLKEPDPSRAGVVTLSLHGSDPDKDEVFRAEKIMKEYDSCGFFFFVKTQIIVDDLGQVKGEVYIRPYRKRYYRKQYTFKYTCLQKNPTLYYNILEVEGWTIAVNETCEGEKSCQCT
jgi:hypothetical protein